MSFKASSVQNLTFFKGLGFDSLNKKSKNVCIPIKIIPKYLGEGYDSRLRIWMSS